MNQAYCNSIKCLKFKKKKHINSFVLGIKSEQKLIVIDVRFEVSMVVTIKNAIFWDVMLCGSCRSRRFGGTYCLQHQGDKNRRARNNVSNN
jgi:hypothetical protein